MSNAAYPYRVAYPRTHDWWDGHWADLSSWCDKTLGKGVWNYYGGDFVFEQESHYLMFLMKWK